jgi:hypothetical protein
MAAAAAAAAGAGGTSAAAAAAAKEAATTYAVRCVGWCSEDGFDQLHNLLKGMCVRHSRCVGMRGLVAVVADGGGVLGPQGGSEGGWGVFVCIGLRRGQWGSWVLASSAVTSDGLLVTTARCWQLHNLLKGMHVRHSRCVWVCVFGGGGNLYYLVSVGVWWEGQAWIWSRTHVAGAAAAAALAPAATSSVLSATDTFLAGEQPAQGDVHETPEVWRGGGGRWSGVSSQCAAAAAAASTSSGIIVDHQQ